VPGVDGRLAGSDETGSEAMMSRMLLGVSLTGDETEALATETDWVARWRVEGPVEGLAGRREGAAAARKTRATEGTPVVDRTGAGLTGEASAASSARAFDELLLEEATLDDPAFEDGREEAGSARSGWTWARAAGALVNVAGGEGEADPARAAVALEDGT
jgi:hypothetical protein